MCETLLALRNNGKLFLTFIDRAFNDVMGCAAVKITEEVDVQADVFYPITCGDAKATLIWKKFVCPGINVKCVQVPAAALSATARARAEVSPRCTFVAFAFPPLSSTSSSSAQRSLCASLGSPR